jgi:uncharacterized cofD-like protein
MAHHLSAPPKPARRQPRIVVIGGGKGSYNVLRGLTRHSVQLTAIVSMADDGGSSGRLRDEFGHLPPGDARRCLLALSSGSSVALQRLFEYRFDRGNGLYGHSFGNLFLTALTEITGRTDLAIAEAGHLLATKGMVLPVTLFDSRLCAELDDGTLIRGETHIDIRDSNSPSRIKRIFLDPPAIANPAAMAAIQDADAIVIGPGDLYSSVLPNLIVSGIPSAIRNTSAARIYVCNLMTKPGETDDYRASDFVAEVQRYLGSPSSLDHVVVNDVSAIPSHLLGRYAESGALPVEVDLKSCKQLGPRIHHCPVMSADGVVHHHPDLLASQILRLVERTDEVSGLPRSGRHSTPRLAHVHN